MPRPVALAVGLAAASLPAGVLHGCGGSQKPAPSRGESPQRRKTSESQLRDRLSAIEAFLGGEGGERCDVPRVDGRELTWQAFKGRFQGQAVVLTGLGGGSGDSGGPAWTRDGLVAARGDLSVRANNGRFDQRRSRQATTIEEYLLQNASDFNVFLVEREVRAVLEKTLAADVPLLRDFDYRPILSLGVMGSPTYLHRHQETWQGLLAGRKAWWLGRNASSKVALPRKLDPCTALATAASGDAVMERDFLLCVQRPGEVMYFGNLTPHATCNLDSFVFGAGAQGHTEDLPALHRAARHGALGELRALLLSGRAAEPPPAEGAAHRKGGVEERDYMKRTALQHGVMIGHAEVVELLLAAGADPQPPGGEPQPLQAAAEFGDLEVVRRLLEGRAAVEGTDRQGGQAAHYAAKGGHVPVLLHLLDLRASPVARDANGAQLLHWAASESSPLMLDLLAAQGGDVGGAAANGDTPLHWAARAGHVAAARSLLSARASPTAQNVAGLTPMQVAAVFDRGEARAVLAAAATAPVAEASPRAEV